MNRFRNGRRNLWRSTIRQTHRFSTRMLGGVRRPSPLKPLLDACRTVNAWVRFEKKMTKKKPHLYGPNVRQYFLDTIALDHQRQEITAALKKVYGGTSSSVSTVWSERYPEFAEQAREELKAAKLVKKW